MSASSESLCVLGVFHLTFICLAVLPDRRATCSQVCAYTCLPVCAFIVSQCCHIAGPETLKQSNRLKQLDFNQRTSEPVEPGEPAELAGPAEVPVDLLNWANCLNWVNCKGRFSGRNAFTRCKHAAWTPGIRSPGPRGWGRRPPRAPRCAAPRPPSLDKPR